MDYGKYENYLRVGNSSETLQDFPTPSSIGRTLHDVDKDPFTDLEGYTHRNRVRHDVEELAISYNILSDNDESYILNAISPEWFYVELLDKKTKQKKVCKMYASDKQWNVFKVWKDENNNWHEEQTAFTVTFVEQ